MTKKPNPAQDMMTAPTQVLEMMQAANSAILEAMGKSGAEFADFFSGRIEQDLAFQRQVAECRDVAELSALQNAFMQKAMSDYSDETGKMVEIGMEAMEKILNRTR